MSDAYIAQILIFAGNFAPRAWAFCEGQTMPIASNTALFSLVGTTYGGDGRTTLGVPDMRGRAAIHAGRGPGLSERRLGAKGGSETNMLTVNQLASHNHQTTTTVAVNGNNGDVSGPVSAFLSKETDRNYSGNAPDRTMASGAVTATVENSTGGGTGANNLQPYLSMYYIICIQGVYPSRS